MLAEKNENIKTAYEILQRVSKSKEARMAYEARQAEIFTMSHFIIRIMKFINNNLCV